MLGASILYQARKVSGVVLVCDRCIDSLPSQKSKRSCIGVIGASILYQARKVSGVVLVC